MASTAGTAGAAAAAAASNASSQNSSTSQSGSGYTSNSNGNFSGGNISNGPLGAPTAPGFASGDYSFGANLGWTAPISMDGGQSYTSMNVGTGESFNSGETSSGISVDDVFGKADFNPFNTIESNKQGDYAASSETETNVTTDTFGKQDDISVTPQSVEENKGVVDNKVVDSVEGLITEQKDKEGQDVLDASKKRSEAEEEDAANNMRDNLIALNKEEAVEENDFQIGDRNENVAAAKAKADEAEKAYKDLQAKVDDRQAELNAAADKYVDAKKDYFKSSEDFANVNYSNLKEGKTVTLKDGQEVTYYEYTGKNNIEKAAVDARNEAIQNLVQADITFGDRKSEWNSYVNYINNAKAQAEQALADYNSMINETFVGAPSSDAQKSYYSAMEAINNSKNTEQAAIAQEALSNVETSRAALTESIDSVNKEGGVENASPQALQTLMDSYSKYNKALKAADNKYKGFKGTDFNKQYAEAVTLAKNFDVTLADGSKQSFADYATEIATKSPTIAAAMYEAKAQQYEEAGYKMLAAIERGKANIMKNNNFWSNLAKPFLGADNKARAMFTNMANTNMRATYNTYNNVINNPNATPEQKAEAKGQIAQANALMTAATALDASTGIGGWGDDMTDGTYGVTDPAALNGWQNFNAHVSNFAQAFLGLGVTPAANKAYQKAFYLNPDAEGFLAKDFDGDGFALTQEYGNNAAAQITFGGVELAVGVALCFYPATLSNGINMITDAMEGMYNSLFGIKNASKDTQNAINTVLNYFNGAAETNGLPAEVVDIINQGAANIGSIDNNVNVFENFQLKSDEVGNLDNWLEGSGSNTATNEKFNQSLSYDEWLKLIESDDVMKEYAKRLTENAKKDNVDKGVNA